MHTASTGGTVAPPAGASAGTAPATREKFLVIPIVILILAQMGATGDNGALSLATAALTHELGATTQEIQLANMVYPLVGGAFMIAGGLVGTIIGWKKSFRIGTLLCAAGEMALAFAPNMTVFIWVGRVLVGFGASFMIPSVLGLIPMMYRGANRMVAFGCIGAASGLSAVLPLMLGVVMETGGMRITFAILSVYFIMVFILSLCLPAIAQPDEHLHFDGAGVALAAAGLFLMLMGLSNVSTWGLIEPLETCPFTVLGISPALPMALAGIVVLGVLVKVEQGVERAHGIALLPRSFLTTPQVRAGLVANALAFFFMGAQSILMAPYLQLVAGWSPIDVGVISIVTGVPTFACALGIPKLLPHANPRHVIQVGYLAMAAALGIMAFSVTIDGCSAAGVYLGAFTAGVGAGTVSSHASNIVALAVNERDASQSGGIQSTMRNVGQAIGVALLGAILLFGITNGVRTRAAESDAISEGVRAELERVNVDLGSDREFATQIAGIPMTEAERRELVRIDAEARFESTRIAYAVGAAIVLLGLATTPAIKVTSKAEGHGGERAAGSKA
ncbi:MFS transporter [Enorma burkinafasonensis]|uniref:MFS transporter n=1 Tax=Enorma burkinafasonensis TaxID=2590867 RepID=UPI0026E99F72|nr:MFS transporter [Enorma burkinafasonensis]MCI7730251.1 MFS transporter [Enorma burkinafasonensis]